MTGRLYKIPFENVSIAASQDLFELSPADDKPIELVALELCNVGGTADAGDAQEELWRLLVRRGHTTSGSGGSAPTPTPCSPNDAAAGFAAEVNNTTIASVGTTKDLDAMGWNVRIPYQKVWLPEERPSASQADTTIVIRLLSTPADAVSCSGVLTVRELP
jgi:hypothetical protein